jgi:hypothetical protein
MEKWESTLYCSTKESVKYPGSLTEIVKDSENHNDMLTFTF